MKLNMITSVICAFIAVLIAVALWQMSLPEAQRWCLAIGGAIISAVTLIFGIGMHYDNSAISTNVRVLSSLTLFIALAFSVIVGLTGFSVVLYLVVAGLIIAVYMLVLNGLLNIARKNPDI